MKSLRSSLLPSIILILSLVFHSSSHAQPLSSPRVLIYCGFLVNLSCENLTSSGHSKLMTRYNAAGFPTTVSPMFASTFTADLTPYKIIIIVEPPLINTSSATYGFTATDISNLRAFLLAGGRLIFSAGSSNSAAAGNELMSALGVSLRFTGVSIDSTCSISPRLMTNITPHLLMTNIASIQAVCPSGVTVGPNGTRLAGNGIDTIVAFEPFVGAPDGAGIVGIGGGSFFNNGMFDGNSFFGIPPAPPGNIQFMDNLVGGPVCDIQMSQAVYTNGQTVTASTMRLANPGATPVSVEMKIWLTTPGAAPVPVQRVGADGSFAIQAAFNQNFGPAPLFTVTASHTRGTYAFSCRLLSPSTGYEMSADQNSFRIQ